MNTLLNKLFSKDLFTKMVLTLSLVLGATQAWGETTIFAGTRLDGWTYKTGTGSTAYVASNCLISSSKDDARTYYSNDKITISSNQKIIVSAKYYEEINKTYAYVKIKLSTDNENWTETNFTQAQGDLSANYQTLTLGDITPNDYYVKFEFVYSNIQLIMLKDPMTLSTNEVAFGNRYENNSQEITVSNEWLDNMSVNISNSNTTDFTISETSLSDITNGSSKAFTISLNYNPSSLGKKSATITLTPTFSGAVSQTIAVSATAISNADPVLSVSTTSISVGNMSAQVTRTFTVSNTGGKEMTVNIESNNTDYYTVSPSSISNIINGSSQTVTVTCLYPTTAEELGEHNATITVTPTYDESDKKDVNISSTATVYYTFDENNSSSWSTGSRSFLFKYQPNTGWNTIIVPFNLNTTNLPQIFGESAKAYELNSYSDNQLSFKPVTSWSSTYNKPYLVYTESAPDNSLGILFYVYISTASTTPAGSITKGSAVFQGTWAKKTYVENDDWYGVTSSGQIKKAGSGAGVKGYHAYFTGITPPSGARPTIVLEDEEGGTTDLGFVKMVDPEAKDIYTLSGQKVEKAGKGIYIVNGRKVVIK